MSSYDNKILTLLGCYTFCSILGLAAYELEKKLPSDEERATGLRQRAKNAVIKFEQLELEKQEKEKHITVAKKSPPPIGLTVIQKQNTGAVKVHRIYTEDMNREGIVSILDKHFNSYNVTETLGRWLGASEKSLMVEATGTTLALAQKAGMEICATNKREAVLITEADGAMSLLRPQLKAIRVG
jgi:hypothetical protein